MRELPAALSRHEAAAVDFGTATARAHLHTGWGHDERDGGDTVVWGLGEASELDFYAASAVPVTLVLECRRLQFEGVPRQTVTVTLNGHDLGEVEVGERLGRHRLKAPAAALERGENRLRLAYANHHRPLDVLPGALDERQLAVQWHRLELRGLGSEGPPWVGSETAERLELPLGSEVAYYFDFDAGHELVIGGLDVWGRRRAHLLVEVETAAGTTSRRFDPRAVELPVRVPLAAEARTLGRLTFAAVRDGEGGGWPVTWFGAGAAKAGVSLLLPMVMSEAASNAAAAPEDAVPEDAISLETPAPQRPDVLIYLIDTLRADRLGVYGYDRSTSPNIDHFAADGAVFKNAQAQSSWTRSAVVSLMTGLLPQVHSVNRRDEALSRSVETLAEILKRQGYETHGIITNGNVAADFGLDQGFDDYRYLRESPTQRSVHQLSDRLNRFAFRWLEERPPGAGRKPFFLYLHASDPHAPYTPPEPFRRRFAADVAPDLGLLDNVHDISAGRKAAPVGIAAAFSDLHDAGIAFSDHHSARLLDKLKQLGLYDSTLIVVVADHGEEFGEHGGWEHGKTLYGEQLRIPLIFKLPGAGPEAAAARGLEIDAVADQVDVLPTVLDVLDVGPRTPVDGRSLLPLLAGAGRRAPSYAYLQLGERGQGGEPHRHLRSVLARGFKLVLDDSEHRRGGAVELYRVETDPRETRELAGVRALEIGFLQQTLRSFELDLRRGSRRSSADQIEIEEELRRRLEALGYLGN